MGCRKGCVDGCAGGRGGWTGVPRWRHRLAYNWGGGYLGGQGGYGWSQTVTGDTNLYSDPEADPDATLPGFNYSGSGLIGGGRGRLQLAIRQSRRRHCR